MDPAHSQAHYKWNGMEQSNTSSGMHCTLSHEMRKHKTNLKTVSGIVDAPRLPVILS